MSPALKSSRRLGPQRAGFAVPLIALLLSAASGCGPQSDRLPISGKVTLDGAVLDSGSIRFTSVGGEKLISSGAMIREGKYNVPQEQGLLPGSYRVEITSPDTKAAPVMIRDGSGGPGLPVARDRIPAEYNLESKQMVDVTADGDNQFDFDVVSRRTK